MELGRGALRSRIGDCDRVGSAGLALRTRESVDAIVAKGVELRRQGKDAEALAEFQRALKIQNSPRVAAQAALAEQALGLWTNAEEDLTAAMSHEGDPWIKKNRATLAKAMEVIQSHLGTLEIWGTPVGAEVFVNNKSAGRCRSRSRSGSRAARSCW